MLSLAIPISLIKLAQCNNSHHNEMWWILLFSSNSQIISTLGRWFSGERMKGLFVQQILFFFSLVTTDFKIVCLILLYFKKDYFFFDFDVRVDYQN